MKVVIDAVPVLLEKTGIGYYTQNLASQFVRLAPQHSCFLTDMLFPVVLGRLLCFNNSVLLEGDLTHDHPLLKAFRAPFPFITFARLYLAIVSRIKRKSIRLAEADLFFGTNYRGLFGNTFKTVLTVHDMSHEYFPEAVDDLTMDYLRNELPEAVRKAALILTDSENSKKDIVQFLAVPEQKVKVVYLGVDQRFRPVVDSGIRMAARQRYGLPEQFILFVGTVQPRKNLMGLVRAFASLNATKAHPHTLVIAGGAGWKNEGLRELIRDLGVTEKVHFTGYIDEADLPVLYSMAEVFALPSLYEGFGLPVIEAMACGVPVLTSSTSCLPEIAGDAAVLVDPQSVEAMAAGLGRLMEDSSLRDSCIAKGYERARQFTWERSARDVLSLFEGLVNENRDI
jgi:glycosyltransferase involved in cell wall biosynthesis